MSDIDRILHGLLVTFPEMEYRRLQMPHAADDTGLWYISYPRGQTRLQLETSTGNCPVLIEYDLTDLESARHTAMSVEEAIDFIVPLMQSWGAKTPPPS